VYEPSKPVRRSTLAIALCVAVSAFAQNCRSAGAGGSSSSSSASARAGADSLYRVRLAKWLRDSIVLDSMTRLVQTDSLYRLYRHAVEPTGVSAALVQAVFCEEHRLEIRYGWVPSDRAVHAMLDTVFQDRGVRDGFAYFAGRAPAEGHVEGGRSVCGPYPPAAPLTIGETRLDTKLPPRPRAP
jgi:hypothetical protein